MRLILIRHGETDWNKKFMTQGHTDIELNETGLRQAMAVAKRINEFENVDYIYSSPLKRAYKTAQIIKDSCASCRDIIKDERLMEIGFGKWEGKTFSSLNADFPEDMRMWGENPYECLIPEGESVKDVDKRCKSFMKDLKAAHKEGTVLVSAHALICKLIIAKSLGLDPKNIHNFKLYNTSLNIIEINPNKTVLITLNDTSHLEDVVAI